MKQFIAIFNKVGGKEILKQYRKAHVLFYALIQTLVQGFSKKSLEIVRLSVDNKVYKKLKKENQKFVYDYLEKESGESECHSNPVVWTSWLQGMDQAPDIVKQCYMSMKEHIHDREIIVITEENYREYVTFPDYIQEKYQQGLISKTHFSDLLRIELLAKYGGTWMDATVFCTEMKSEQYMLNSDLFLFQCLKPGLDGHSTAISSWFMTACSNNKIILLTRALLYHYWETHDSLVDYFLFHDFFQIAIETYPEEWNKVIPFSSSTPHILLLRLFTEYDESLWNAVKEQTCFHKMTYKFDASQTEIADTYYDVLFGKKQEQHGDNVNE